MISENLTSFAGRSVEDWDSQQPHDPAQVVSRIRVSYDDSQSWVERFHALLDHPKASEIDALVVGMWTDDTSVNSEDVVEALVAARDKLQKLRHLFLGDIISEECEISWVQQCDLSILLQAYPRLEDLTVRGGENLRFGSLQHTALRELTVQAGGMRPELVSEIANADLPNLEHLELWLGEPNYGGEAGVADLASLLKGDRFPKLKYLGLKDSVIEDEIARAVAVAPITQRIKVLDLSMGTLGDEGAQALLESPAIAKLEKLDLHHHFISIPVANRLAELGPEVNLDDRQEPHEWRGESHRFIEVGE